MRENWKVVPAQPGWKLAEFVRRDGATPACFVFSDIIAWGIAGEIDELGKMVLSTLPITVDGTPWGEHWMIKSPSKFHETTDGGAFEYEEDALEWAIKEWGE